MTMSAKWSLLKHFSLAFLSLNKKTELERLSTLSPVEVEEKLSFSARKLKAYHELVGWKGEQIHPTFPYALLTHLQLQLVTHPNFPFPPFGLIHKCETISLLGSLRPGHWHVKASLGQYRVTETSVEMELISELRIDQVLVWKSVTLAVKKLRQRIRAPRLQVVEPIGAPLDWSIPVTQGFKYGFLSGNLDPIHLSVWSARLMGQKRHLIHGMWTLARGISELNSLPTSARIFARFLAPIYLPAQVQYQANTQGFQIISRGGERVHLIVEITDLMQSS